MTIGAVAIRELLGRSSRGPYWKPPSNARQAADPILYGESVIVIAIASAAVWLASRPVARLHIVENLRTE